MNDTPNEPALEAVIRLHRIELAHVRLDYWRERYELASLQISRWEQELKAANHLSQTGDELPQQRINW